jgi:septum formation topological specificity factor MinE
MFTSKQLNQLSERGITLDNAEAQLRIFIKGISPVTLISAATPDNGIEVYDSAKTDYYTDLFQKEKFKYSLVKFVPASGAASRMFKTLFEALVEFKKGTDHSEEILQKEPQLRDFFYDLKNYPFYEDLEAVSQKQNSDILKLIESQNFAVILGQLLSVHGLSYGELPKGLLKFHRYPEESRTAFEEHFAEAGMYLKNNKNEVKLHFTVSPEHRKLFEDLSKTLINKYSDRHKIDFKVEFSEQKPSTDTIAVDMDNKPFLNDQGMLLFRPGGHGALLDNMQEINEEIVFVGNIDNVAPDRTKTLRVRYKELLAGVLIERVQIIHAFLTKMESGVSEQMKKEMLDFIEKYISSSSAQKLKDLNGNDFNEIIRSILNRPVRVCGMVKNVGEPGGGPFWISDTSGKISKQIVESSQVNLNDSRQDKIFRDATHFNPVDMVCYTHNFQNEKFKLEEFRDPDMAFIAIKSQSGKSLKALELPGLWNGSMAGWLTFFVDVPIETFSPVKTIFDLRRDEHIA